MAARPEDTRSQDPVFVHNCNISALQERLPLDWSTPANTRPSPKKSYRSSYQYQGCEELEDPTYWENCDDFDLLLCLLDFNGLRDVLAEQLGWTTSQGQVPFDPISMFLLTIWQIVNNWSRAATLRNLQKERYADYARLFGFRKRVYPTEGGLRHFLTELGKNATACGECLSVQQGEQAIAVGVQQLNQLLVGSGPAAGKPRAQ